MFDHMVRNDRRLVLSFCIVSILLLLSVGIVQGQASPAVLIPGQPAPGVLNDETFAQIFTFQAVGGDVARLLATNGDGLALGLLLSDSEGGLVAQSRDSNAIGQATLDAILPADGDYFVTVLPVPGVDAPVVGNYQLTLQLNVVVTDNTAGTDTEADTASAAPPAATDEAQVAVAEPPPTVAAAEPVAPAVEVPLVATTGIQVSLEWNTGADLDLELRDPVGGALFASNPSINSGGTLGVNVNGGCQNIVSDFPTETASWPASQVPAGSYEVLVYYQQGCQDTAPVPFIVNIAYDGGQLVPIQGTLLPGQVYVSSFVIQPDETGTTGRAETSIRSGVKGEEQLPASAAVLISEAQPIELGQTAQGIITSDRPYQSYSFTAAANNFINVTLNATSGSLDPYVAILDPNGNLLYFNDDAGTGITDSVLQNSLLAVAGQYTLVATRYGLSVGGTEGDFALTLQDASAVAINPTPDPNNLGQVTQQPVQQPVQPPVSANLPPAVQALNLPAGFIEVTLVWASAADLQLLVRDPFGEAVFDDTPSIRSGGRLIANGNVNCVQTQGTPVSYIYWPVAPTAGDYEIDVWFQNECNDTTPITFELYVTVGGQPLLTETLTPATPYLQGNHFVTSFTIDTAGNVLPGEGGVTGLNSLPWQTEIPSALPITSGGVLNGSITLQNKFDLYAFQGFADDNVTISLTAAPGTNLDPTLYLIGPSGGVVAQNDDAETGENINSIIDDFTLPDDGQYIIIATHYGESFGVSTGAYTLTLDQ